MGFSEDYNDVSYGFKHTLSLIRGSNDNAIFRHAGANAGKITLTKVSWFMPHVMPADAEKYQLYKTIHSKSQLEVGIRSQQCDTIAVPQTTKFTWRLGIKSSSENPRYVIVGFQTGKSGNSKQNHALFGHVSVKNISNMPNSASYPAVDNNASFTKMQ